MLRQAANLRHDSLNLNPRSGSNDRFWLAFRLLAGTRGRRADHRAVVVTAVPEP